MVAVELPADCDTEGLKRRLYDGHRVEVPVQRWRDRPLLRASFQGYNDESDLDALLSALRAEL
jgi:selenocysteine lyase/cysteine desulfurase